MVARGYKGVCDKDGCDFNSWRLGDQKFYGRGATEFKVDSRKSLTVVTQFLTEGAGACWNNKLKVKVIWKDQLGSLISLEATCFLWGVWFMTVLQASSKAFVEGISKSSRWKIDTNTFCFCEMKWPESSVGWLGWVHDSINFIRSFMWLTTLVVE